MRRYCKLIISTITVALIFTFVFSPSSYALGKQQFGAWIASALSALNIVTSSTVAPYYNLVDDYLADPFTINEQSSAWDYLPYTFEDTDDFYDRSVLKVDKDTVTIDGVEYSDVWLSTDASEKFRVNAFDLKSAFNIASNSEGTFVSGAGTSMGVPVFQLPNGQIRSQVFNVPVTGGSVGNIIFTDTGPDGNYPHRVNVSYPDGWTNAVSTNLNGSFTSQIAVVNAGGSNAVSGFDYAYVLNHGDRGLYTDMTPFDFDWVSGNIPADAPLTDEGLRIRVPTSDIDQWYQDYPDTGSNVTINMGDPDLETKIDDLIDLIIPLIPILDIDFVDYDTPEPEPVPEPIPEPDPYPDPDPQPGTVIPDLDWSDLFQTIKNIYNKISESVSITTAIKNLLDKIKWFLDDFFGDLGDLIGNLPDLFESHVIDTIRRSLTGLKNIFLPIITLLRNALGIWHYVVEWFQAISTPFTFYLNLISQGYPLITIPIYASIAGIIVIAVYRRFGR